MKTRNAFTIALVALSLLAQGQLPGDGGPGGCTLKNKHCEITSYPPGSTIPGCSSNRTGDCSGVCHKTDHTVTVGYCAGQLLPGGSCPLTKTDVTSTGTYTACVPHLGYCDCDSSNPLPVTTHLIVYRCGI